MSKSVLFLILFLCASLVSNAQEQYVFGSAGAHSGTGSIQLSWTIGEPVTVTGSSQNSIITQGFHQSKLTVISVEEHLASKVKVSVFPNPTKNELNLTANGDLTDLNYKLFNSQGQQVLQGRINSTVQKLVLGKLSNGIYHLIISNDQFNLRSVRIVKQN